MAASVLRTIEIYAAFPAAAAFELMRTLCVDVISEICTLEHVIRENFLNDTYARCDEIT